MYMVERYFWDSASSADSKNGRRKKKTRFTNADFVEKYLMFEFCDGGYLTVLGNNTSLIKYFLARNGWLTSANFIASVSLYRNIMMLHETRNAHAPIACSRSANNSLSLCLQIQFL
jgi:hypothetical protein